MSQVKAFLEAYSKALSIVIPRTDDEPPETVAARMHGMLVAAAWCALTVGADKLTDETWLAMASAALQSAREREAMLEAEDKRSLQ